MSDNVDIGLNLQGDQYLDTMGQAVAITKQYVSVADGMAGGVANLNQSMVALTQKVTMFNKVNTVALDQAAAYQKAFAGIESKAAVTGKSFTSLEKTTKSLGKSWGGDMAGAIQTVEALQASGVKSETTIARLGKAYMSLGAATGTVGAEIGTQFLQMSRTFGNGAANFEKLSDSLVGATSKIGGSAPAVVAFSKALAPVASTVGIGQTAVMGLSTAMSALGEDGYRAANTFNKVMLDMNRTLRDGGPELKAYADIIGTTTDKLSEMWKADPTEVLTQFTEAVAKQGPGISRTLDALGFDSVRDTRSLTALARSGGPRAAIQASVDSYGDGSTATAAEIAHGGVVDTAGALKESMSQVVGDIGAPMLGIAKTQLDIAKSVSDMVGSVTSSTPGQAVLKATGVGSLVGSAAGGVMTTAAMVGMGQMGYNFVKGRLGPDSAFGAGRGFALQGETLPAGAGPMAKFGWGSQAAMAATSMGAGGVPGWAGNQGWGGRLAARGAGMTADAAARGLNMMNTNWLRQLDGKPPLLANTSIPAQHRAMLSGLTAMPRALLTDDQGARNRMAMGRMAAMDYSRGYGTGGAFSRLGQAAVMGPATAAQYLGGRALSGIGMAGAGLGALGISGATLGIGAAIGGGMYAKGKWDDAQSALSRQSDTGDDIYSKFNDFANAAGMATRGLVAFSAQVESSTTSVVSGNKTMADAYTVSKEEVQQSQSAGYKTAFNIAGESRTAEDIAAQVQATLGPNASAEETSRAVMDVANQTSGVTAQEVADILSKGAAASYDALFSQIGQNSDLLYLGNAVQSDIGTQAQQAGQQAIWSQAEAATGEKELAGVKVTAQDASRLLEFTKAYQSALDSNIAGSLVDTNIGAQNAANMTLAKIGGLTPEQAAGAGLDQTFWKADFQSLVQGKPVEDVLAMLAEQKDAPAWAKAGAAMTSQGQSIDQSITKGFMETPEMQLESQGLYSTFARLNGAGTGLSKAMYEAEDAANLLDKTTSELTDTETSRLSTVGKAINAVMQNPNEETRWAAGRAVADQAMKDSDGNTVTASAQLKLMQAQTPDGPKGDALRMAEQILAPTAALVNAGQSQISMLAQQVAVGRAASQMPVSSNPTINSMQTSLSFGGTQAQAALTNDAISQAQAFGGLQTSIGQAQRSAGVAAGGVARDLAINLKYAGISHDMQTQYAGEDYERSKFLSTREKDKTVRRSKRDFARQERYGLEDKNTSVERATQDKDRQELYALEDHNRQKKYATDDYEKSRLRATRDYNKQVERATRDFQKGQERAEVDFNKSQTRAQEDFNKGMKRMVEDSAKTMYDPYKRMAAQHVLDMGQLLTNLADQQKAMDKQMSNVDTLKGMGLSKEAIQQLSLTDSTNAQQVSRLLSDAQGNPETIQKLNAQVAARTASAGKLVQNDGNMAYDRAQQDFATQQQRSTADYTVSKDRNTQDFGVSMSDSAKDFTTAMDDAQVDFDKTITRMDEQFDTSLTRNRAQFDIDMDRLIQEYDKSVLRGREVHDTSLGDLRRDHATTLKDMHFEHTKAMKRMDEQYAVSLAQMKEKAAASMASIGAGLAAQISAMYQDFFGVGRFLPEGQNPFLANIEEAMQSGLDPKKMSQEWQDRIKEAFKELVNSGVEIPPEVQAWAKEWGLKIPKPEVKSTAGGNSLIPYTPSPPDIPAMSVPDALPDPPDMSAWDKFRAAMQTPITFDSLWPDDMDNLWPDNWDFLAPDVDWATFGDNLWPDDWSKVFDAIGPDDMAAIGDNLWPDDWDFLFPDVDWAGIGDNLWPDDWSNLLDKTPSEWVAVKDSLWPDNWDFLFPDVNWAGIADNLWPDDWSKVLDSINADDWSKVGDAIWPDNWDFLFPDVDWEGVADNLWPDDWSKVLDSINPDDYAAVGDAIWPDNWDFLFPDVDWTGVADNMWPDDWTQVIPNVTAQTSLIFDAIWPDNWDWLWPDIDWGQALDRVWPDDWNDVMPDTPEGSMFDSMWPDTWGWLLPEVDWTAVFDAIWPATWNFIPALDTGRTGDFFDAIWPDTWGWLLPDVNWTSVFDAIWPDSWGQYIPDLDVSNTDGSIWDALWPDTWGWLVPDVDWNVIGNVFVDGVEGIASRVIETWNSFDLGGSITTPVLGPFGGFDWDGWTVAGHEIIPPQHFPGITMPSFTVSWPDVTPTLDNPFKKDPPKKPRALGGIVMQREEAILAEAGYPEAVIPLNQRGADVLAATMARYIDNDTVRGSQTQEHSVQVVNYNQTYDYRTQFTGPVSVQAQNPDDMAQQLAARQRRQRLAQPVGGR